MFVELKADKKAHWQDSFVVNTDYITLIQATENNRSMIQLSTKTIYYLDMSYDDAKKVVTSLASSRSQE